MGSVCWSYSLFWSSPCVKIVPILPEKGVCYPVANTIPKMLFASVYKNVWIFKKNNVFFVEFYFSNEILTFVMWIWRYYRLGRRNLQVATIWERSRVKGWKASEIAATSAPYLAYMCCELPGLFALLCFWKSARLADKNFYGKISFKKLLDFNSTGESVRVYLLQFRTWGLVRQILAACENIQHT